ARADRPIRPDGAGTRVPGRGARAKPRTRCRALRARRCRCGATRAWRPPGATRQRPEEAEGKWRPGPAELDVTVARLPLLGEGSQRPVRARASASSGIASYAAWWPSPRQRPAAYAPR